MDSSTTDLAQQIDELLRTVAPAGCLTDDALRDRLVECERAMSMLQSSQADAMVQIGARARAADEHEAVAIGRAIWSWQRREEFVCDEIAVLLACTKMAAATRYDTACRAQQLPEVRKAWRAGSIDGRKVATICEQVNRLNTGTDDTDSGSVTRAMQSLAADAVGYATAPGRCRTEPQLREWLRRRVIAADPAAAEERRQQAMADRRVVITAGDDGLSELWALLPSVQARQVQQSLTTTAQRAGAGDERTMDQRRADALVDLLLGRAEPAQVDLHVVVTSDSLIGASTEPAWVSGVGPVTTGQLGELLAAGADAAGGGSVVVGPAVVVRRLLTDPTTGTLTDVAERGYRPSAALDRAVRARDVTCRFPGCRRAATSSGTDLDHTVPWPTGSTAASNLAVLCRHHHRLKHSAGWSVTLDPTGS